MISENSNQNPINEKYKFNYINPKKEKREKTIQKIKELAIYATLITAICYGATKCSQSKTIQKIRNHTKTLDTIVNPIHQDGIKIKDNQLYTFPEDTSQLNKLFKGE